MIGCRTSWQGTATALLAIQPTGMGISSCLPGYATNSPGILLSGWDRYPNLVEKPSPLADAATQPAVAWRHFLREGT